MVDIILNNRLSNFVFNQVSRLVRIISETFLYSYLVLGIIIFIGLRIDNFGWSDAFVIAILIFTAYYRIIVSFCLKKEYIDVDRRLYLYLFVLFMLGFNYFTLVINGENTYLQSSFWLVLLIENTIELFRSKYKKIN